MPAAARSEADEELGLAPGDVEEPIEPLGITLVEGTPQPPSVFRGVLKHVWRRAVDLFPGESAKARFIISFFLVTTLGGFGVGGAFWSLSKVTGSNMQYNVGLSGLIIGSFSVFSLVIFAWHFRNAGDPFSDQYPVPKRKKKKKKRMSADGENVQGDWTPEADEESRPSALEIANFARYLGMDPVLDAELLWVAEEALVAQLPDGWGEYYDADGFPYYWNADTLESQWQHPLDDYYRDLYRKLRNKRDQGSLRQAADAERESRRRTSAAAARGAPPAGGDAGPLAGMASVRSTRAGPRRGPAGRQAEGGPSGAAALALAALGEDRPAEAPEASALLPPRPAPANPPAAASAVRPTGPRWARGKQPAAKPVPPAAPNPRRGAGGAGGAQPPPPRPPGAPSSLSDDESRF